MPRSPPRHYSLYTVCLLPSPFPTSPVRKSSDCSANHSGESIWRLPLPKVVSDIFVNGSSMDGSLTWSLDFLHNCRQLREKERYSPESVVVDNRNFYNFTGALAGSCKYRNVHPGSFPTSMYCSSLLFSQINLGFRNGTKNSNFSTGFYPIGALLVIGLYAAFKDWKIIFSGQLWSLRLYVFSSASSTAKKLLSFWSNWHRSIK